MKNVFMGLVCALVACGCGASSDQNLYDSPNADLSQNDWGQDQFSPVYSASGAHNSPPGQSDDTSMGIVPPASRSSCHPLAISSCALPFPSNWFSTRDESSPTGIRLRYPDNVLESDTLAELPPELAPASILRNKIGFSAATPILFEVQAPADPTTLPSDGGSREDLSDLVVAVFDTQTGERVPIRAEISSYSDSTLVTRGRYVLRVFPRSRFAFNHHYVAVLTDRLQRVQAVRGADGKVMTRSFAGPRPWSTIDAVEDGTVRAYHEPLIRFLERRGLSRSGILAVTDFTTRTEEDASRWLLTAAQHAYDGDHPVRNILVLPGGVQPHVQAFVSGEIRLTDFRAEDGGIVDDPSVGQDNWVPFLLTIPNRASKQPSPVAIYSHPLTLDHHVMTLIASTNAVRGFATIAIDHPNHGARIARDGGYVMGLKSPKQIRRMLGMAAQSPIDQVSLLKALRSSLRDLDVAPYRLFRKDGDGRPDLDSNFVVFEGTSLGGVLGTAFLGATGALDLGIRGGFLQVSGSGFFGIFLHSTLWSQLFHTLMPKRIDGAEAEFALAAVGYMVDQGDSLPVMSRFRAPLLVTYGIGDAVVPNSSTFRLAEITGLPLINPVRDASGLDFLDYVGASYPNLMSRGGYGLAQAKINRMGGVVPFDVETHITFLRTAELKILETWLETVAKDH